MAHTRLALVGVSFLKGASEQGGGGGGGGGGGVGMKTKTSLKS